MDDSRQPLQRFSASCLCGASTFTVPKPTKLLVCHCLNCKKWSGSTFAANFWVPASSLIIDDTSKQHIRSHVDGNTESRRTLERHFCGDCGSSLYIVIPHMPDVVAILSGVIDGLVADGSGPVEEEKRLAGLVPKRELYTKDKCPWVSIQVESES